eukprot:12430493-Karenia_brevis.AAC.1
MTPPERDGIDSKSRKSSKRYSELPPPTGGFPNYLPPSGWFPSKEGIEDMPGVKHLFPEYYIK